MMHKFLPQYKSVPIFKSHIHQVLDSNIPVLLTAPCEQENLESQSQDLLIEPQAGFNNWGHALLHPLIKLQVIKHLQPTITPKISTSYINQIHKNIYKFFFIRGKQILIKVSSIKVIPSACPKQSIKI